MENKNEVSQTPQNEKTAGSKSPDFMLYGANGYTGELIIREASAYGLQPLLAGRREEALAPLAARYGFSYRVVDLENPHALAEALKAVKVVVHAAGPFQQTARQMALACLKARTHYLDINGDVAVFEMLKGYDEAARAAGILMMPGAGFDVVPSDCLALYLKRLLPEADHLQLAFSTLGGGISHGTASSIISRLGDPGAVRRAGRLVAEPVGKRGMWVSFGSKRRLVMSIPWGDLSTAYVTTGIPNMETYAAISPGVYRMLKWQFLYNWLLRTAFVRNFLKRRLKSRPAGPSDEQRRQAVSMIWGRVADRTGKTACALQTGPDGYTTTVHSSLLIVQKVLQGKVAAGFHTPAGLFGEDLVLEIPGVKRERLRERSGEIG